MKCNSIAQSSLVVLSLLLTVAGAHAQSATRMPCALRFQGRNDADAGRHLQRPEATWHQSRHGRNVQTGTSVLAMGRQESPSKKTDKLIFHRYGSQYFLTEILEARGARGWSSPPPGKRRSFRSPKLGQTPATISRSPASNQLSPKRKRSSLRLLRFRRYRG